MKEMPSGRFGRPISFRISNDLKEALDKSADRSGRTLSAEMAIRLEQSVDDDKRTVAFRDPIIRLIAAAVEIAEAETGHSWQVDARTANAVRRAVAGILLMLPSEEGLGAMQGRVDVGQVMNTAFDMVFPDDKADADALRSRFEGRVAETQPSKLSERGKAASTDRSSSRNKLAGVA